MGRILVHRVHGRSHDDAALGRPTGCQLLDGDVAVGVDANVGGDVHGLAHDRLGIERPVEQRARGGERIIAARADAHDAGLRLEHVAGAGQHQRHLRIGDDHHGFEAAQIAVGAPVLGELDGGAGELPGILLELGLQPLEQREGIGGGAGKAADHVALAEPADLLGIGFDDGLADRDLAVAADHDLPCLRTVRMVVPCQYQERGDCMREVPVCLRMHRRHRRGNVQLERHAAKVADPAKRP